MSHKVEQITEALTLGEGPHWDAHHQALFFVDIYSPSIHKYVPASRVHTSTKLEGTPGFIVPIEGTTDQFVVGLNQKFVVVQWDGKDGSKAAVVREVAEVDQDVSAPTRINDGKADPRGRIYGGTMSHDGGENFEPNLGSMYRLDGSTVTKLGSGITIANGLSWDLKEKAFYYTDSMEYNIRRYDYDVETGDISNKTYIFDFKKNGVEGVPDGHTIDTDGNLWVALFSGSSVVQIDPRSGRLLRRVAIPAEQVTSATFGGPGLDVLFVTTASIAAAGARPPGGATYSVTGLGVKGYSNKNYKLS